MAGAKTGRTILLAEDDLEVRSYLETALKYQGYSVELAQDGEEALACFNNRQTPISAVVMDVVMPRKDGIDALKEIRRFDADVPVIMISGAASPLNIVDAMKNGANDFIAKPVEPADLRKALKAALGNGNGNGYGNGNGNGNGRHMAAGADLQASPLNKQVFFGTSPQMQGIQGMLAQVGWSEAPVLIRGETGVGKEVLARELHARSPRAKKPMLKLNCAALPSELVESELFGYERGAFTGAFQKKPGMFELADGGTILLDEIGDMDFRLQAKLLQVLQDQQFQRLGGKETISVDVRIIAATHRDLERAIVEERFREDLYYRLNVISIRVPPLREHREDIIGMAEFLVKKHAGANGAPVQLPPALKESFVAYSWPGNVRQLENIVRKYIILRDARTIEQELRDAPPRSVLAAPVPPPVMAPEYPQMDASTVPVSAGFRSVPESGAPVLAQVERARRDAERSAILAALEAANWNRRRAAAALQVDYKALLYKMKRLDIRKEKASATPIKGIREAATASASAAASGEAGRRVA
jgi:two-component system, NtrC family, response regulator AtoC